jgi:hypothetical protein
VSAASGLHARRALRSLSTSAGSTTEPPATTGSSVCVNSSTFGNARLEHVADTAPAAKEHHRVRKLDVRR